MRLVSRPIPQFRRTALVNVIFYVLAVAAAYLVARYIVAGDIASLGLSAIAILAGIIVLVVLENWRRGLYFLIAWLLFEDLARKFLGNNMAVYFAKDFLLAVIYLSFFRARRRDNTVQMFRPPFLLPLLALVWFGAVQVFNPASTHIAFGLLGMKLDFYYIPLMLVSYALIDSEQSLRRFFMVNLALMGVITLLGVVQSIAGPQFLNPAIIPEDIRRLSETYRVAPISGTVVYRPTSVFVSAGRFGNMLIVNWLIVFGFSGYLLLRHRSGRVFTISALAVTAAACIMCGSRGPFMWSLCGGLLGAAAFIWGAPWRQREALRVVRTLQRTVLAIAAAALLLLLSYPDAFLGRIAVYSETLDPRSPTSELVHRAHDYPLANFLGAFDYPRWPYGYGIGTASLGVQYVARFFKARAAEGTVESGFGVIVIEMGILGLIFWVIMSSAVVLSAWRVVRKLKGSPFFPLGSMIMLYAFILLFPMTFMGMQPYQDFILNSYLWLLLGVLFRLPHLLPSVQMAPASTRFAPSTLQTHWVR